MRATFIFFFLMITDSTTIAFHSVYRKKRMNNETRPQTFNDLTSSITIITILCNNLNTKCDAINKQLSCPAYSYQLKHTIKIRVTFFFICLLIITATNNHLSEFKIDFGRHCLVLIWRCLNKK